jgi:hypothetical protein
MLLALRHVHQLRARLKLVIETNDIIEEARAELKTLKETLDRHGGSVNPKNTIATS